jgi:general nucleoside transport system permease protein
VPPLPTLPDAWALTLASAALSFGVPLLLAGIGECLVERAGVINIGIEGLMLAAALAAVLASSASQCAWLGLLAGIGAGAAGGLLFGW